MSLPNPKHHSLNPNAPPGKSGKPGRTIITTGRADVVGAGRSTVPAKTGEEYALTSTKEKQIPRTSTLIQMDNKVTAKDFLWIRKFIYAESAIKLEDGKEYLISSRLTPIIRTHGFCSIGELIQAVRDNPRSPVAGDVIDAITTNETSFFRDVHPFESLVKDVLPPLIAARQHSRKLRIWTAACSSGQEPLSIMMTILEDCPELTGWDIQIVATDLSRAILSKAQQAEYSQLEMNRGLPARLMLKYFDRSGIRFKAKPSLTQHIAYRYLNLAEPWTKMPIFDLVFIRNVLIYFDDQTKTRILEQARLHMTDDAWLALGGAESMRGVTNPPFTRSLHGRTVWYQPE